MFWIFCTAVTFVAVPSVAFRLSEQEGNLCDLECNGEQEGDKVGMGSFVNETAGGKLTLAVFFASTCLEICT